MPKDTPTPAHNRKFPAKPLFSIIAGIVAADVEWAGGISSRAFGENLATLKDEKVLDCGVALSDCAFDTYAGELVVSHANGSLASFLFRLIQRLQALGTVPAVDWNKYGSILSDSDA